MSKNSKNSSSNNGMKMDSDVKSFTFGLTIGLLLATGFAIYIIDPLGTNCPACEECVTCEVQEQEEIEELKSDLYYAWQERDAMCRRIGHFVQSWNDLYYTFSFDFKDIEEKLSESGYSYLEYEWELGHLSGDYMELEKYADRCGY